MYTESDPSAKVKLLPQHMAPEYTISLRGSDKGVVQEKKKAQLESTTVINSGSPMEQAMFMMAEMFGRMQEKSQGTNIHLTLNKQKSPHCRAQCRRRRAHIPAPSPATTPAASSPAATPAASPPAATPAAPPPAATRAVSPPAVGMTMPSLDAGDNEEAEHDADEYLKAKLKRPACAESSGVAKKPKTGQPKLPTGARPAKIKTGDATVHYMGGKVHRNEKASCY